MNNAILFNEQATSLNERAFLLKTAFSLLKFHIKYKAVNQYEGFTAFVLSTSVLSEILEPWRLYEQIQSEIQYMVFPDYMHISGVGYRNVRTDSCCAK